MRVTNIEQFPAYLFYIEILPGANAQRIYAQAVATHAMPLGNLTHMTDAERAQLGAWIRAGANI